MSRTLVIKLPDELEKQLEDEARLRDLPLEDMVLLSLEQRTVPRKARGEVPATSGGTTAGAQDDPITPLLGSLRVSGRPSDVAERHDHYLASALWEDLQRAG